MPYMIVLVVGIPIECAYLIIVIQSFTVIRPGEMISLIC